MHQAIVRTEATPLSSSLLQHLGGEASGGGGNVICMFAWCAEGDNLPDGIQVISISRTLSHTCSLTCALSLSRPLSHTRSLSPSHVQTLKFSLFLCCSLPCCPPSLPPPLRLLCVFTCHCLFLFIFFLPLPKLSSVDFPIYSVMTRHVIMAIGYENVECHRVRDFQRLGVPTYRVSWVDVVFLTLCVCVCVCVRVFSRVYFACFPLVIRVFLFQKNETKRFVKKTCRQYRKQVAQTHRVFFAVVLPACPLLLPLSSTLRECFDFSYICRVLFGTPCVSDVCRSIVPWVKLIHFIHLHYDSFTVLP